MFKIEGLDKLQREMKEFSAAMGALDGDIANVRFDPEDPASIEQAIQQMEAAIDERVAGYSHNQMVMSTVGELKENYREAILERAAEARLSGDNGEEE